MGLPDSNCRRGFVSREWEKSQEAGMGGKKRVFKSLLWLDKHLRLIRIPGRRE